MHPDIITAGITYSWGWWTMASELTAPLDPSKTAEFYMVLDLRNLPHHLTTVRDTYERVTAKGYHVIYREFGDLGERTYHPVRNDDAIAWATRLHVPLSEPEKNLLKPYAKVSPPASAGGFYPAIALVGGSPAGEVLQKLFESKDAAFRLAAAETCRHAIFDEVTTAALGRLLADPAVPVRRAAGRALAMYAHWRSALAQQALIQAALDTAAPPDDRGAAADGIVQAVALQVRGVRQDPELFRVLVTILSEKYEPLHAVAYLAHRAGPESCIHTGRRARKQISARRVAALVGGDRRQTGGRSSTTKYAAGENERPVRRIPATGK
jgi:hypothetical protein